MGIWSDIATWRGPTPNQGPAMNQYRGLVVHIASGFYEGTISWQKNPDADVSSHFVTGRADNLPLAQCVDTDVAAWTQRDGNGEWLSIECEGFATGDPLHDDYPGWERLTDHQMDQIALVLARAATEYGVPLQLADHPNGRGLGYHSMGAENGYNWGHSSCPGEPIKAQLPEILRRAQSIGDGDMQQSDRLAESTNFDQRTVGNALADTVNLRNYWYSPTGSAPAEGDAYPAEDSRLGRVVAAAEAILAGTPLTITDGQLDELADRIAGRLSHRHQDDNAG